ncbi:TPR-like protein [Suillus subluteus]|nr:TPR-like protein [Suillus subluteus]
MSDLDEAIVHHRAALELLPPCHSNRSIFLNNLALSLRDRFLQRGIMSDLDEAIELHRAALLRRPPGHSDRPSSLNNLAASLHHRFLQRGNIFLQHGNMSDIDEAIELHRAALELHRAALELLPPCHSNRSILHDRFQRLGIMSDLDEAIEFHWAALELLPSCHSDRSILHDRFKQQGIMSDIDEVIELRRAALLLHLPGHSDRSSLQNRFLQCGIMSDLDELLPPYHSNRYTFLDHLAANLHDRFQRRGIMSDLDEVIELHRAALELPPSCHSDRSILYDRFKQQGTMSDLDEAIDFHRAALLLRLPGHSDRSSLQNRFLQCGMMSDLDEAIELHRAALELLSPCHSNRSMFLNNLRLGIMSDLDEVIELHRAALELLPSCHSDRSILHDRFKQQGIMSDLDEVIELRRAALLLYLPCHSDWSSLQDRFLQYGMMSDLDELLPLCHPNRYTFLDHLAANLRDRFQRRGIMSDLDESWAASAHILNHDSALLAYKIVLKFLDQRVALSSSSSYHLNVIEEALVEQSRAVFWTQSARFSIPLDELSASGDIGTALAEEFKRLSFRADVVTRIRMLRGFSRFLLPPLFSDLQKAAEDGPVIILNASQYSCDTLIIHRTEDPIHAPLDITQAAASELSSEFQSLAEQFGSSGYQDEPISILRKLWAAIVGPVVQVLRETKFTPLPLHAAGPYKKKRQNLSDIYISSYTPTLATLVHARQRSSRDAKSGQREGAQMCRSRASCLQGVLDALNHNQWLHLACHGMPNQTQPFESSFAMRDGPLMIKDIIRSDWQNLEFAFLSTCRTAVGDENSPHESIHLAAAMQFSGFRSVIGSMWSVDDDVARQVVSAFYGHLVDSSGRLDCTRAAVALHTAMKSLRKKIPLEQQFVFVHIGV